MKQRTMLGAAAGLPNGECDTQKQKGERKNNCKEYTDWIVPAGHLYGLRSDQTCEPDDRHGDKRKSLNSKTQERSHGSVKPTIRQPVLAVKDAKSQPERRVHSETAPARIPPPDPNCPPPPKNYHPETRSMGSTPHSVPPLLTLFSSMELKTLAELDELHDKLIKKSAVLQEELEALELRIDALKAAQRKYISRRKKQ